MTNLAVPPETDRPPIRAMPGRVILKFPPPKEQSSGGIIIPVTSAQRIEMAEIFDVGAPTSGTQEQLARFLRGMQESGAQVLVTFGSGVGFWHNRDKESARDEWSWLADFRAYRMEEISAFLEAE